MYGGWGWGTSGYVRTVDDKERPEGRSRRDGMAHFTVDHPVGKMGKPMRVVIRIQDHLGRRSVSYRVSGVQGVTEALAEAGSGSASLFGTAP